MSESDLKDDDRRYHLRLCCFWGILSFVFLLSGNLAAFNVDSGQKLFLIYKTQIVPPVKRLDLQTLAQDSHQGSYRKVVPFKTKPRFQASIFHGGLLNPKECLCPELRIISEVEGSPAEIPAVTVILAEVFPVRDGPAKNL